MTGPILFRLRAELRTRWLAWFGLALLVGTAGGTVTALAAGAERTDTTYARFLDAQRAVDALIYVSCDEDDPADTSCFAAVRSDPAIAESAVVFEHPAGLVTTVDGAYVENADDPCWSGPGDIGILADPEGVWGTSINRHRIVAGRAADPTRADEAVISESLAQRNDLRPGDTVLVTAPNPERYCVDDELSAAYEPETFEFTIVGIQRSPFEIVPASGFYVSSLFLTPAFLADTPGERFQRQATLAVRLATGHSVDEVVGAVEAEGGQAEPIPIEELRDLPADGIAPYATALSAAMLVALLVAIAVFVPALVRRQRLDADEQPALWALGMSRRDLRVLVALRAFLVATASALTACVVAIGLSPFFPIGDARPLEPDAGIDAAWSFVALGAIGTATLVLLAALPGLFVRVRATAPRTTRRPLLAGRSSGLPVSAWCGVRLAFSQSSAAAGGVLAVGAAVVALVGALTFSAGVQHLLSTPRLVGQTWDAGLAFPATDPEFPAAEVRARIADHPAVLGHAEGSIWSSVVAELGPDRVETPVFGFDSAGLEPALVSGRVPAAPDEIALGPKTLDALGFEIGDEIEVHGYDGNEEQEPVPTVGRYRIVGVVVPLTMDNKGLGYGAVVTLDGLERLNSYSGADVVWMRLAPGTDREALAADVYGAALEGNEDEDVYLLDGIATELGLVGIGRVDAAPVVLAALLGVLALGVLAQLLVSATSRNRRSLAILGVLGLARRRVRATVRWQAIAYTVLPVVVGVPVGVALGRVIFHEYAQRLGAVPEPVTPWLAVIVLIPVAFAVALACAAIPAWRAARRNIANALRAE